MVLTYSFVQDYCGDGICNYDLHENCTSCPFDCADDCNVIAAASPVNTPTCPTCQNGGSCDQSSRTCICPRDYTGPHCEQSMFASFASHSFCVANMSVTVELRIVRRANERYLF